LTDTETTGVHCSHHWNHDHWNDSHWSYWLERQPLELLIDTTSTW